MVFHFISFSIPSSSPGFLRNEVQTTLQAMEMLLTAMAETGTQKIIFPSSGGTIYGETNGRPARETDPLNPLSSYGLGKLLCEEMIRFYGRVHNLQYLILRGSNVYGAPRLHRISQGIIDVFLERIMKGEELTVWGNPGNVRDYIFIDDFIDALFALLNLDGGGSRIINIGSGEGVSVRAIIKVIAKLIGAEPAWRLDRQAYSGIPYNVLDVSLLRGLVGWKAKYSLEDGIAEVWRRKRAASSEEFLLA
jgi:UDP-glucose 4-epimerase